MNDLADTPETLRAQINELRDVYLLGKIELSVYQSRVGVRLALIRKLESERLEQAS